MIDLNRTLVLSKNVVLETIRDRILFVIVFYGIILAIASRILPEFAASTEDKMFLDVGLAAINLLGLIVAVFVGVGMVNKEIDKRTILMLIAKPVGRSEFILAKYLGLSAVLAILVAGMTGIYLGFLYLQGIPYSLPSILLAALFIQLQISLIAGIAIAFGVFTSSLLATALTFGVYLIGNITQDILKLGSITKNPGIERLTQILYLILPDLSRLDLKNDAVYGMSAVIRPSLLADAGYSILYAGILLALAIAIFANREF